jgi:proteasome lid subunit RPN8/RPN11
MDQIRAYACDSLLQLSHGGRDVGGVLFGTHQPDGLRIVTWRPIASDYADGEHLRLSHRDRMKLAVQLEAARVDARTRDLPPVGWFVSHPHGEVAMTPADLETYGAFFPEAWQITLVIHPTENGRAEAGFFVREADGSVRSSESYRSFELVPPPPPADANEPAPLRAPPQPVAQETAPSQAIPLNVPPQPVNIPPPRPKASLPSISIPVFETDEPLPTRERWLWAIPILLALGIAGWLLYHHHAPAQTSTLAFRVSGSPGGVAQLEWNADSSVVRNSEHGEIDINDSGKTSQVMLSSDQLHFGKLIYLAQSGKVAFDLIAFPSNGTPVHEKASLIDPSFTAPATAAPSAPSAPTPNDAELQQQVQKLTQDLRRERARADQLQGLVRILEQRLQIDAGGTRGKLSH